MIKKLTVWSIAVSVLSAGLSLETQAQKSSATKKKQPATQTVTNDKTRSRRVASASATPTPDAGKKDPAVVTEPTATATPSGATTSTKPAEIEKPDQATIGPEEKPAEKVPAPKIETPKTEPAATTDSIESLRTQIEEAPPGSERIALQLKLADLLVAAGAKTEALAELNRVATSDTFDPAGLYNLGNSFARLGDTEGAVGAYRKAIEQRRGRYSKAYNNLGVVLLRVGRWDDAYDAFLSALKLESFRYAEASYNLGRLYAARGEHDLAVREWRRALAVDPMHKAAAQAISGVGYDSRITVAATGAPGPLRDKSLEPRSTSSSSSSIVEKPKTNSAGSLARSNKPLTLDPISYDYLQRGRSAAERGKPAEAIEHFRRVISRQNGYFAPANLEASYALLTLKKYDEALANLVQVSSREGARYPISYFHLARLYELRGDLVLAETAFGQAAAAFGTANTQFLLDLSRVREKQSNFKGALDAMEKYVAAMDQQGIKPTWSEEKLAALKSKVNQ